jgi:hypothetical protein
VHCLPLGRQPPLGRGVAAVLMVRSGALRMRRVRGTDRDNDARPRRARTMHPRPLDHAARSGHWNSAQVQREREAEAAFRVVEEGPGNLLDPGEAVLEGVVVEIELPSRERGVS